MFFSIFSSYLYKIATALGKSSSGIGLLNLALINVNVILKKKNLPKEKEKKKIYFLPVLKNVLCFSSERLYCILLGSTHLLF